MEELLISVSLVDIKEKINGGIILSLNLMIKEESYDIGYWINKNKDIIIYPEQKLLDHLGINELKEYELYDDLVYFIYDSIPIDKILKEYF